MLTCHVVDTSELMADTFQQSLPTTTQISKKKIAKRNSICIMAEKIAKFYMHYKHNQVT